MEQKKTLWIALLACGFLLAVFGTATLLFSSRSKNAVFASTLKNSDILYVAPPPAHTVINANSSPVQEPLGIDTQDKPSITNSTGSPQEGVTDIDNGYTSTSESGVYQQPQNSADKAATLASATNTTPDLDSLKGEAEPTVTPKNEKARQDIQQTASAKKTTAAASTTKKSSGTASASTSTKTEKKSTASTTKSSSSATTSKQDSSTATAAPYWVQVSSYASKKNADEAREELDKNQIPCEVFTFNKDGTLYYRVRVGPYTTKKEAEYWKQRIDSIDMFKSAGSFVTK